MIGRAIEHFLKLREMKQSTLAEKAEVSTAAVTQYIKGTRNPSEKRLEIIASILEVSIKELNEVAKSFEDEEQTKENYIDDRQLRRRLSMIYGRSDLAIELSKYVIFSARFRVHDLLFEADASRRTRRPVMTADRETSPIEAVAERVLSQFFAENKDEIADRMLDELDRTQTSVEEIVDQLRKDYDHF